MKGLGRSPLHLTRARRLSLHAIALVLVLAIAPACRTGNRAAEQIARDSQTTQQIENDLSFDNITLEQPDEQGNLLWKVESEQVTYSQDKQLAEAKNPKGELYRNGKPAYRIQGQRGRVQQDGERILLLGQVMATDVESGAVLKGDELEWKPQEGLLIVRNNLQGTHPRIDITAKEATLFEKDRRLVVTGGVLAKTKDPQLTFQGDSLTWLLDQEKISSDRPVQVTRAQPTGTDTATASGAEMNLATQYLVLQQNARVSLAQPDLQITSDNIFWNLQQRFLDTNQPVTVVERQQQVTLTANRGRLTLEPRVAYLNGNVRALGQRNGAQLTSDSLIYDLQTRQMRAEGNVNYQQANPPLNIAGPRADGNLETQNVVVTGGTGGRVSMEIVPPNQ